MKNLAIYTVIVDGYDSLKEPVHPQLREEADFYCFTNSDITSDYYTVVPIEKMFDSATLTNRYYKILSHPVLKDYQYTLYLDGSLQIITDTLQPLVTLLEDNDVAMFKHRRKNCIYQEARAIIGHRRADCKTVFAHVKRYSQEGFPRNAGLVEAGAIVRNNQSSRLKAFEKAWWHEFYHNTHRDQLSFNYVLWKHPIRFVFIQPGNVARSLFFEKHEHHVPIRPNTLREKIIFRYWKIRINMLRIRPASKE